MYGEDYKNWNIIHIEGLFTIRRVVEIKKPLESYISIPSIKIAFDLSKVKYIDSSAITLILNFHKRLKESDGEVVIIKPSESIQEVLSIIGIDQVLQIYESKEHLP